MLHKIWKKYKYKRTHSFNNIKMEKQQQKKVEWEGDKKEAYTTTKKT